MENTSENTIEICETTGLPKNTPIEYFLDGKSLGVGMIPESHSMPSTRILAAKKIGIDYYDRFVIDRGDTKSDSATIKMKYNGVLEPYTDFKEPDPIS